MVPLALLLLPLGFPQSQEGVPQFDSVIVVFAEEDPESLVSSFGHLFVCLPTRPIEGVSDLMGATALNVGADLSPLGNGAWIGEYKLRPFHELVRKNIRVEQRALSFFELELTAAEINSLQSSLQRRVGKLYPYEFFRQNCGFYLLDWLGGKEAEPKMFLYLSPREALAKILARHPPRRIWQLPTDHAMLEAYLDGLPTTAHQAVAKSLKEPQQLNLIEDLTLRLLTIKVAEARAKKPAFDILQKHRQKTLSEPGGASAASQLVRLQEQAYSTLLKELPTEAEGPLLAFGSFYRSDLNQGGVRIQLEAGLRDRFSAPPTKSVLREVKFLNATIDTAGESTKGDFLLASVSTQRSFTGITPATSNGAATGYAGLPNTLGLSGLYANAWAGLSWHTGDYWIGSRMTLGAEDLQSRSRLLAAPGMSLERRVGWSTTSVRTDFHLQDGAGWSVEQFASFTPTTTLAAAWLRSPHGEDLLTLTVQIRF